MTTLARNHDSASLPDSYLDWHPMTGIRSETATPGVAGMAISRRALLGAAVGATAAALAGCAAESRTTRPVAAVSPVKSPTPTPTATATATATLIGDGSTQDTGPQPHQP